MNRKDKINNNKWLSLSDDLMGRIILSELEFAKHFIVSITDYTYEDLEDSFISTGEELLPEQILNSTFRTDIILTLNNGDKVLIEIQKHNNLNSTNKNDLYGDRTISEQKIENNNYENIKKLTQIVIIYDNQVIPKESRVLIEKYDKTGEVDNTHKIMEKYRTTIWLDLQGEVGYTKVSKELNGWIILFKEDKREEALKAIKYDSIFRKVIRKVDDVIMNFENGIRYIDQRKDYDECLKNLGREEGIELGTNKTLLEVAYKMYQEGVETSKIMSVTGIDINNLINSNKKTCKSKCNKHCSHNKTLKMNKVK